MKKQFVAYTISLVLIGLFLLPISSVKAIGLPFGGLVSWVDYELCTCPPMPYIWYTPLWLGGILTTGAMAYSYATILYEYYMFELPGVWHLGTYTPDTPGAEACWMYVVDGCVPIPVYGLTFMMGTSLSPSL